MLAILGWVLLVLEIGLRLFALGVIPGNRKPSTGMAWLLVILFEPIIGFTVYLILGRTRLGRRRHERQERAMAAISKVAARVPDPEQVLAGRPPYLARAVHLNRTLGAMPLLPGNAARLLPDYHGTIAAMAEAVDDAQSFVHVEFYITAWDDVTDPLFQALVRAADRGVEVRLLFDHLGSRGIPGYRQLKERLDRTRIAWQPMLPIKPLKGQWRRPDLRNHRKLLVVDNVVGFTGSLNLTEPGYNKPKNHKLGREWVELMVRLEGPIVVTLNALFAADWYKETGERPATTGHTNPVAEGLPCQLVPSGPGYVAENNLRLFNTLVYGASRRISITSPYFVPDESLLYAVTTAAQRGVDIELFVSKVPDQFMVGHAQASYYQALLEAGVVIYQYPAPYILHAKHFTIDDEVAVIGSSNMDMRSFALNYEVSLMMLGEDAVARMREVEDAYRAISPRLTLDEWKQRPARTKYVDNVMRLTAALQ